MSDQLVNRVEHWATEKPNISLRSWWRERDRANRAKRVNIGLIFGRWPELQILFCNCWTACNQVHHLNFKVDEMLMFRYCTCAKVTKNPKHFSASKNIKMFPNFSPDCHLFSHEHLMLPRNSYHLKTKFSGLRARGANVLIGLCSSFLWLSCEGAWHSCITAALMCCWCNTCGQVPTWMICWAFHVLV